MKKGNDLKPHIGIFGRRNNGKSSFVNALIGQEIAIVSDTPGTTTDPVKKTTEIFGIGPTILIDTAGIDDVGALGEKRVQKTKSIIKNIDLAILVIANNEFEEIETTQIKSFQEFLVPYIIVHNKSDQNQISQTTIAKIRAFTDAQIIDFSSITEDNKNQIIDAIKINIPETAFIKPSLFTDIVKPKDVVLLVNPIDTEAPEGRMILPQVMSWRDVLDKDCIMISVKETELKDFLKLKIKPALTVVDSQVFNFVAETIPSDWILTSFSILFARLKGDIDKYILGTKQIDSLEEDDNVMILESCTHQISCEDIGRHKIPKWLQEYTGKKLNFDIVAGVDDIPHDINDYALVIQCGGCVATSKQINNRINYFFDRNIPITNYGLAIAYINGIFNRVTQVFDK
jgi:[FeFe] hydrogenase H-cluster maturation GTPase HydF